jgi:hypothetical protein
MATCCFHHYSTQGSQDTAEEIESKMEHALEAEVTMDLLLHL